MSRKSSQTPTPSAPLPAAPAPAVVEALRAKTRALCDILERETRALSGGDVPSFLAAQAAKQENAKAWHTAFVDVSAVRAAGPGSPFPDDVRAQLQALHATLSATIERNRAALERSARSFQRLGERIVTHARRAATEKSTVAYSAAGTVRNAARRTLSMGLSESA